MFSFLKPFMRRFSLPWLQIASDASFHTLLLAEWNRISAFESRYTSQVLSIEDLSSLLIPHVNLRYGGKTVEQRGLTHCSLGLTPRWVECMSLKYIQWYDVCTQIPRLPATNGWRKTCSPEFYRSPLSSIVQTAVACEILIFIEPQRWLQAIADLETFLIEQYKKD